MKNSTPQTNEEPLFSSEFLMKSFRILGWIEGGSMLLLMMVAMPLKYIWGYPQMTRHVGMAHGLLFVAYVLFTFQIAGVFKWKIKTTLMALIGSVFPFGTFVFDYVYLAKEHQNKGANL